MTYIHHYSIIQSSFTVLKILHVLLTLSTPNPQSLASTDLFIVFRVLPFPECYVVGIV